MTISFRSVLFLILAQALSSCAVVYKTAPIGEKIKLIEQDFIRQIVSSKKSTERLLTYWEVITKSKEIPRDKAYDNAQDNVDAIKHITDRFLPYELKAFKLYTKKRWEYIGSKEEIIRDESRYNIYIELKKYIEEMSLRLKSEEEKVQENVAALKKYAHKVKLFEVQPKSLSAKVKKGLAQMDKQVAKIKEKLDEITKVVNKTAPRKRRLRKSILAQLNHIINKIETTRHNFEPVLERFNKETAAKTGRIIIIPEMASHSILKDIEKIILKIRKLGKDFNQGVEDLKAI